MGKIHFSSDSSDGVSPVRTSEGTLPTDYTFTGQKVDASAGLMYYGARYYDAQIGGVPPVAHETKLETLIDQTLLRFQTVWAAAGAPNALFAIEVKMLLELTHGRVADIVV